MAYLVASAEYRDLGEIQKSFPETWRRVRRYNLPVQLALAAAEDVMLASRNPEAAAVISLAPCQPGSADLYRWGYVVTAGMASGNLGDLRMNPTQTLHAVDNLALSAFAIASGNRSDCLGLGGAAGQAWCGLEAVLERLEAGNAEEALLMAGDQDSTDENAKGLGTALLFSQNERPFKPRGCVVRLVRIERRTQPCVSNIRPHAATGLSMLVSAIKTQEPGWLSYDVPEEQTDGFSSVTIVLQISPHSMGIREP
jgi:hypothetical protein